MEREGWAVRWFAAWAVVVVLAWAVLGWVLAVHLAQREALDDAARQAARMARAIAAPIAYRAPAAQRDESLSGLDVTVRERIAEGLVLRVKVWDAEGTVLYSDEHRLIGRRFDLDPTATDLLVHGGAHADLTMLDAEENVLDRRLERGTSAVVEAYAAFTSRDGADLLFEAYLPAEDLIQQEHAVAVWLVPAMVAGPVVVGLLMFALGLRMSRRIRVAEQESARALQRMFTAAAQERRLMARHLHDTVLPELAAVRLTLEAVEREETDPERRTVLGTMLMAVTRQISFLRDLLTGASAPSPSRVGLKAAVDVLADQSGAQGVPVDVAVRAVELGDAAARLVLTVVGEGLRNVHRHARAGRASVSVRLEDGSLVVEVEDDGCGTSTTALRSEHGLGLIADTVADLGGETHLETRPSGGTRLRVAVPLSELEGEVVATSRTRHG